jgi:hypothetical protein
MRGIWTVTPDSSFSADDGGVSAVQSNGNRVGKFRNSEKTLYIWHRDLTNIANSNI